MKKKISVLTALCLFLSQTLSLGAVTMQDLRLPRDFYPSKSPNAQIASVKENPQYPGFLTFEVTSSQGSYTVNGLSNLKTTLQAIDNG